MKLVIPPPTLAAFGKFLKTDRDPKKVPRRWLLVPKKILTKTRIRKWDPHAGRYGSERF
jgi:hypothetical protein